MKIKGFDKDLQCRGFQFEVGKTYDTGKEELELCTDSVFHYCDSIEKVNIFYDVLHNNRFCEIEVLGKEVTDGRKCGSNRIKIVREIVGKELCALKGLDNGNTGLFNSGERNTGYRNSGNKNTGDWNSGSMNSGNMNSGNWNTGDHNNGSMNSGYKNTGDSNSGNWNSGERNSGERNSGDFNSGDFNSGDRNSGYSNNGDMNSGNCNSGDINSGDRNSGYWNTGDSNSGDSNSGNWNSGYCNSGDFNSCNYSSGFFCNQPQKVKIFNIDTNYTYEEFYDSVWWQALTSCSFNLTYMDNDELKTRTYKEACAAWWEGMTDENKEIIKTIPNFSWEVFTDITGIAE